mmetsp:Transcript_17325/g.19765  ORF Transcript_17325/g.19765 Transcript_17325/m.19765 type:complete len:472 (-) Transcript_17325:621-2036(-)
MTEWLIDVLLLTWKITTIICIMVMLKSNSYIGIVLAVLIQLENDKRAIHAFSLPRSTLKSSLGLSSTHSNSFRQKYCEITVGGLAASTSSPEPSVTSLLDGEQEQVIVNRSYVEEEILLKSNSPRNELLMSTEEERKDATKWIKKVLKDDSRMEAKRNGGGGGFGGGGASKSKGSKKLTKASKISQDMSEYSKFNPKLDIDGHGAILQQNGVVRINNVLSKESTQALLKYVDDEKINAEGEVARGDVPQLSRFTRVLLKSNRCDLLLPLDKRNDIVMQALYELLGGDKSSNVGAVGNVIESALSADSELYEFACLISDPGSDRQVIHPDIAHQGETQKRTGPLLTCFVALQDIDNDMGPSEFLPHTNTAEYHRQLNDHSLRDEMLSKVASKISLLREGDCSIFDATTLHAGTANRSDKRRRLFYFTFRSLAMEDPRTWNNPGSIRPELKESKLSLRDIQEKIQQWRKKKSQ